MNFFYRVFVFSWLCFWKVVFSKSAAQTLRQATRGELTEPQPQIEPQAKQQSQPAPQAKPQPAPEPPPAPKVFDGVQLLALLQQKGRLIDFLMQDVHSFSDEDVASGARVVHEGCNQVLKEFMRIEPLRTESEGDPVTIQAGYDPALVQLSGNVQGQPPYSGELVHHGWKLTDLKMPEKTQDSPQNVLAPAEIEI